jgi:hypothetical protein
MLRDQSTGPTVKLIVWQHDHYHQAEVHLSESRRLGVIVTAYRKQ